MARNEVEELLKMGQPPSSEEVIQAKLVGLVEKVRDAARGDQKTSNR